MEEKTVEISLVEYQQLITIEARVDVLVDMMKKDRFMRIEDIFCVLGRSGEMKEVQENGQEIDDDC